MHTTFDELDARERGDVKDWEGSLVGLRDGIHTVIVMVLAMTKGWGERRAMPSRWIA